MITKESIKSIAQTIGIPSNLSDEVASSIAQNVDYKIRELTEDAVKFMKHCHRDTLRTDDIDSALRLRRVDSLYGCSSADPVTFRHMTFNSDELYFQEDIIVNFDDIIQEPLPPPPVEPTFSVHWLAVEGEQPICPQNPSPNTINDDSNEKTRRKRSAYSNALIDGKNVKTVTKVEHVLSKEQQLYYTYITDAIKGNDQNFLDTALLSLREDAGLQQLLPYFTRFIASEVADNLKNVHLLTSLIRMTESIIFSKQLNVEPYLHQLMPSILTCLVGKRLCNDLAMDDHWKLRDYSAELLCSICKRFGHIYEELQPRITKTLALAFLNPEKPLTTHYGAIKGLSAMGHYVIKLIILPNVELYMKLLEPSLDDEDEGRRIEARHCLDALLHAVGTYVQKELSILRTHPLSELMEVTSKSIQQKKKRRKKEPLPLVDGNSVTQLSIRMDLLFELFGEALLPYTTQATIHGQKNWQHQDLPWSVTHTFI